MNKPTTLSRDDSPYAVFWRMLHAAVQSYGTVSTGELLTMATVTTLNQAGYQPTVSELSTLTRLPKSNISRYVSALLTAGLVAESIDKNDRRRRQLCLTAEGRNHATRMEKKSQELAESTDEILRGWST